MFLAHYAAALAAKRWAPQVSLGTLFLASVWLDLLWSLFLLLGWETVVISPNTGKFIPIDFTYYSLSHSLVMAMAWAIGMGLVMLILTKNEKSSLVVAGLVVAHWFLNVIVHRSDMFLLPSGNSGAGWGWGLWNSIPGTILVEGLLFAAGIWVYLKSNQSRDRFGPWIFGGLCFFLSAAFIAMFLMPLPQNGNGIAMEGQIQLLFVAWGYWADDHWDSL